MLGAGGLTPTVGFGKTRYWYESAVGAMSGQAGQSFIAAALLQVVQAKVTADRRFVFGNVDQPNDKGWAIIVDANGVAGGQVNDTDILAPASSLVHPASLWQLVVMTYNKTGNKVNVYNNGELVKAEQTVAFAPASGIPTRVGADTVASSTNDDLDGALIAGAAFADLGDAAPPSGANIAAFYNAVKRSGAFAQNFRDGLVVGTANSENVDLYSNQYDAYNLLGSNRTVVPAAGGTPNGGASDTWSPTNGTFDLSLKNADSNSQRPFLLDDPQPQFAQPVLVDTTS